MPMTYISTNSLSTTLRNSAMNGQIAVAKANKEATTGRFADVGLTLGGLTGRDVVMRAELTSLDKYVDTNGLVSGRLGVTQTQMDQVMSVAQKFQQDIMAARDSADGGQVLAGSAKTNLEDLISTLNVTADGHYLFAGINNAVQPIVDYAAGSSNKNAVDAAFSAAFGMTQGAPGESGITAANMQNFLDTTFAAQFADPAWGANWSSASDQVERSDISATETVDSSISANESGFRKLAMAYTALTDLGTQNMNQAAFQTVVDTAAKLVGEAVGELALAQGHLGSSQERTTAATAKQKTMVDLITQQVTGMEKVDPTEASVRVASLQNQVEMSLALTARMQNLSILNYLP